MCSTKYLYGMYCVNVLQLHRASCTGQRRKGRIHPIPCPKAEGERNTSSLKQKYAVPNGNSQHCNPQLAHVHLGAAFNTLSLHDPVQSCAGGWLKLRCGRNDLARKTCWWRGILVELPGAYVRGGGEGHLRGNHI